MSLPTGIALSPDGYLLASAGRDKVLTYLRACALCVFYLLKSRVLIVSQFLHKSNCDKLSHPSA